MSFQKASSSTATSPVTATNESLYSHSQHSSSSEITSISSVDSGTPLHESKPLHPGVYVPTVVFFEASTENLDLATIGSHAVRLAKAGVAGITTQGSNGEAVHLSHSERKTVTLTTRRALDAAGFPDLPIIVGCGVQSVRETIQLCRDAAISGGDYALILPPSYYKPSHAPEIVHDYFTAVADASPVPVLIYNYPGAVSGLDMDSDAIVRLAKHPNIVGCKLTCGNTGKLARIAAATSAASPLDKSSPLPPSSSEDAEEGASDPPQQQFMCMGGSADFTLQTLIVGGSGVICGIGNVAPKACVRVFDLFAAGKLQEARKAQEIVARGDAAAIKSGIVGTKSALDTYYGYGGWARRPLPRPSKEEAVRWKDEFKEIVEFEHTL